MRQTRRRIENRHLQIDPWLSRSSICARKQEEEEKNEWMNETNQKKT